MKAKLPLLLVLTFSSLFIVACADEMSAQDREDLICGKVARRGGTCYPNNGTASGTATPTATATSTVTVTQTN